MFEFISLCHSKQANSKAAPRSLATGISGSNNNSTKSSSMANPSEDEFVRISDNVRPSKASGNAAVARRTHNQNKEHASSPRTSQLHSKQSKAILVKKNGNEQLTLESRNNNKRATNPNFLKKASAKSTIHSDAGSVMSAKMKSPEKSPKKSPKIQPKTSPVPPRAHQCAFTGFMRTPTKKKIRSARADQ